MMRCRTLLVAGIIVVSLEGVAFTQGHAYHLYFGRMPGGTLLIAAAGWGLASYGPPLVAALFWMLARRSSVPWVLHLLLIPSVCALLVAGSRLMLSTLYVPDFDATLGAPIMPALLSITVTLGVYFSALAMKRSVRSDGSASG